MDFIDSLYNILGVTVNDNTQDIFAIAQEAEDITGQAASDAAQATGSKQEVGKDIDLNTDDVLGTKTPDTNEDGSSEKDNEDKKSGNTDNTLDTEDEEDDNPPENPDEDEKMQEDMQTMKDPFEENAKKNIWKQFRAFHKTLSDSITLITKYVPNISDAPTIKAMDNIKENLVEAKDLAYRILTEEYRQLSYPEMQKKYIGLHHIYDICTNELETYFDNRKKK